jgi:NIPSNAP
MKGARHDHGVPHPAGSYRIASAPISRPRRGWAIERAVMGDCAGSYFVEIGTQQSTIQMWRFVDVGEWSDRRAKLAAHLGWKAFRGRGARQSASASRLTLARRSARALISWYRLRELDKCRRAAVRAAVVFWLWMAS